MFDYHFEVRQLLESSCYLSVQTASQFKTMIERGGIRAKALDKEAEPRCSLPGVRYEPELGLLTIGDLAVIPISGTLTNRMSWYFWSYREIAVFLQRARQSPVIKGILLDWGSPGGNAAGMPDLAHLLNQIKAEKPVISLSGDLMASAAFGIGCQAGRVLVTPNSYSGSIGVLRTHFSYGEALNQMGIEATLVFSGKHKVEGNNLEALPKELQTQWQAEMDVMRREFCELVAMSGRITSDEAMATEAAIFRGQDAVDAKLADEVVHTYDVLLAAADFVKSETTTSIGITMTHPAAQPGTTNAPTAPAATAEQAAPPAAAPTVAALTQADIDAAVTKERDRVNAILALPEASGRQAQALELAKVPGMNAEQAKAILAAGVATPTDSLGSFMAGQDLAPAGPDGATGGQQEQVDAADAILSVMGVKNPV